jgi:anti-sigma regulatory factor (Ser/Thr protein kinase)
MNDPDMRDTPRRLQMKFAMPSDPRYLPVVRGAIGPLAAAIGWDESECRAITLALDEALANVIRHAYHNCASGLIELECREIADGLEITVLDKGDAPDRSKICAREIGCDQAGGLGTHIIRDVMDKVSYEVSKEGNRFVACKILRKTS